MELQGIQAEQQTEIKDLRSKLEWWRQQGSKLLRSQENFSAEKVNLLASLSEKHYQGTLVLGDFLQAQGKDEILDELLSDLQTLDQAQRRLSLIHGLLSEIDDEDEESFPGKAKARAALADLSLDLKKLIRLNNGL